jgi:histidinol phosphate phosphatase HisJ family
MILDYHMHLEPDEHLTKCPYHKEQIEVYVQAALSRGTSEIGVSEHCNRFREFRPMMDHLRETVKGESMREWLEHSFAESLDEYVDAVLEAQHAGMPVKLSIEVDYLPGHEEAIRKVLSAYPFDYVIGSVHFLGPWAIDSSPDVGWPEADVDETYREYFRHLVMAARSGLFDTLAHPDLVKKFGHRPSFPLDELYDEIARAAKESGVAVEVSSAGLFKPVGEIYPAQELLQRLFDRGVPITLGSDAHRPEQVSAGLDQAVKAAAAAGYRHVTRFESRRPTLVELG